METIQPVIAALFVMGLLLAVLLALKKKGMLNFPVSQSGTAGKRIELLERVALGPQHALHLIRAGDRCVLIVTAPSSCQVLDFVAGGGEQK